MLCLWLDKALHELTDDDFDAAISNAATVNFAATTADRFSKRTAALRQVCFQQGHIDRPPRDPRPASRSSVEHAADITQPAIRRDVVRYAQHITTTLRPVTGTGRIKSIRVLCDWLAAHHPEVTSLDQLDRSRHIEPFRSWAKVRPWRGANGAGKTVGLTVFHHDVVDLRVFFEDIAEWGWPSAPQRRLVFLGDIPRIPEALPRALTPAIDRNVMAAISRLDDRFARVGIGLLRATGMRVGELLDLELDCIPVLSSAVGRSGVKDTAFGLVGRADRHRVRPQRPVLQPGVKSGDAPMRALTRHTHCLGDVSDGLAVVADPLHEQTATMNGEPGNTVRHRRPPGL